jgi:hypothetical protein
MCIIDSSAIGNIKIEIRLYFVFFLPLGKYINKRVYGRKKSAAGTERGALKIFCYLLFFYFIYRYFLVIFFFKYRPAFRAGHATSRAHAKVLVFKCKGFNVRWRSARLPCWGCGAKMHQHRPRCYVDRCLTAHTRTTLPITRPRAPFPMNNYIEQLYKLRDIPMLCLFHEIFYILIATYLDRSVNVCKRFTYVHIICILIYNFIIKFF